jgi:hypothetical protein
MNPEIFKALANVGIVSAIFEFVAEDPPTALIAGEEFWWCFQS